MEGLVEREVGKDGAKGHLFLLLLFFALFLWAVSRFLKNNPATVEEWFVLVPLQVLGLVP